MTEHDQPHHFDREASPDLPPELADFLRTHQYAALLHATDQGSVLVVKAPGLEIENVRGQIPIEIRHELYRHPSAPVIRMLTRLYDQPQRPLALETFVNIDDEQQRADYGDLARQDELNLLFYDEQICHRLAKRVRNGTRDEILKVLLTALRLRAQIADERFDFDRAKADVIFRTSM